jgi:hypothetical protein
MAVVWVVQTVQYSAAKWVYWWDDLQVDRRVVMSAAMTVELRVVKWVEAMALPLV